MNETQIPIKRKILAALQRRISDMYNSDDLYIADTEDCDDRNYVFITVFYRDPFQLVLLGEDISFVDLCGYK